MKFLVTKLDRWIVFGNCLVGYIFDSPQFDNGTRVQTEAIRFVDPVNMEAECLDGKYKLCDPGTADEHKHNLIGCNKPGDKLDLEKTIILNPNG